MLAPSLFRVGMAAIGAGAGDGRRRRRPRQSPSVDEAVVIGAGPVGQRVASTLEMRGVDVCIADISPVNLHRFAPARISHGGRGRQSAARFSSRAGVSERRLGGGLRPRRRRRQDRGAQRAVDQPDLPHRRALPLPRQRRRSARRSAPSTSSARRCGSRRRWSSCSRRAFSCKRISSQWGCEIIRRVNASPRLTVP